MIFFQRFFLLQERHFSEFYGVISIKFLTKVFEEK